VNKKTLQDAIALAPIVALGIAVRLWYLSRPMQSDEAYTYNEYALKPLLDGLSWYTFPNNHLLNTLLVHASIGVFGGEPWAVRLPALAAGVLLIPAGYAMVAGLSGRAAGLFAAALIASSEPLINYSINARGYIFICLITTLLVDLARRIREGGVGMAGLLAFGLLSALGFFAIPIMLYPYGGIVLWLLLTARFRGNEPVRLDRMFASALLTAALTVLLYLPAVMRTGLASVVANPFVLPQPFDHVLRSMPDSLASAWLQWNFDIPRLLTAAGVLAWIAALARPSTRREGAGDISCLLLIVLVWSTAVALAQRVIPYDRVWLFALPIYAGCIASGLAGLIGRRERLAPALAVLLCLVLCGFVVRGDSIGQETRRLTLTDGEAIALLLKPTLRPGDGVLALVPCDAPLKYEFLRHGIPVEYLYDYRIAGARRLYVAVGRSADQDVGGVLDAWKIAPRLFTEPTLVRDFGDSALYVMDRR
jgi:hypothetical protein